MLVWSMPLCWVTGVLHTEGGILAVLLKLPEQIWCRHPPEKLCCLGKWLIWCIFATEASTSLNN